MDRIVAPGGFPYAWLVAILLSMLLPGCALLTSPDRHAAPPARLLAVHEPRSDGRTAVVLVGGINDTYHFLDRWGERYRDSDFAVYNFECNFASKTMTEAAEAMEAQLDALSAVGFERLIITAHSMGGLIAKHALDRMVVSGSIARYRTIELNALGSPWGGFHLANLVRYAPFPVTIGRLIGYPMGLEIGSGSDFMRRLTSPLPKNVQLNVFHGAADSIATPRLPEEIKRFNAIVNIADRYVIIPDVDHVGFREPDAVAQAIDSRSRSALLFPAAGQAAPPHQLYLIGPGYELDPSLTVSAVGSAPLLSTSLSFNIQRRVRP